MRRPDLALDNPRHEVRLAQQEAIKASAPPPPPPVKRSREKGITPKEAPTTCPKVENQGMKGTPTSKVPPSVKAKITAHRVHHRYQRVIQLRRSRTKKN